VLNSAGRAVAHVPLVDVMVNATKLRTTVWNCPTAVQFPGDVHDTELKIALGSGLWTPFSNSAGRAVAHVPLVDVMVNASLALLPFVN